MIGGSKGYDQIDQLTSATLELLEKLRSGEVAGWAGGGDAGVRRVLEVHVRADTLKVSAAIVPTIRFSKSIMYSWNDALGSASSSRSRSCRAVDDAGVEANLSVGRESRSGDDSESGDLGEHFER